MTFTIADQLYVLIMSDGMGNSMWSENEKEYLDKTKKYLAEKYGESDFRTKYLTICLIRKETEEFTIQQREWVRYILHQESEPDDQHERLLDGLKERMQKGDIP